MLLNLPQDAWLSISLHLSTPDVLSLLSTHRTIHQYLSTSPSFWARLLARDRDESYDDTTISSLKDDERSLQEIRQEFMLQSYKSALPAVKWIPLNINRTFPVTPREGHLSCILLSGTMQNNYKSLVITGGFTDDDSVTVMRIPRGCNSHSQPWGWDNLTPVNRCSFVYGASLTSLPPVDSGSATINIGKAVRFGGFQGGGYSHETNEVYELTIRDEWSDAGASVSASWERIQTTGVPPKARAYHTATLIHERYLVIIGGMTREGCVMEEAILDSKTWSWIDISLATTGHPMGRHGHSVILDSRRDRLVMFGGGSGTDLIRSGVDTNEVWELKMRGIKIPENLDDSKLWEWNCIHGGVLEEDDSITRECGGATNSDVEMEDQDDIDHLTPAESLCLGRCHNGMMISPDTVLLMFGGGRINTNGVLGYDLSIDTFIRPTVFGTLPLPRFTGIAEYLAEEGYIFVHGGFNTNFSESIQDITLLDIAPFMERNFVALQVDTRRRSCDAVTDEEARGLYTSNLAAQRFFSPSSLFEMLIRNDL